VNGVQPLRATPIILEPAYVINLVFHTRTQAGRAGRQGTCSTRSAATPEQARELLGLCGRG
jgi:hypothetical protein